MCNLLFYLFCLFKSYNHVDDKMIYSSKGIIVIMDESGNPLDRPLFFLRELPIMATPHYISPKSSTETDF